MIGYYWNGQSKSHVPRSEAAIIRVTTTLVLNVSELKELFMKAHLRFVSFTLSP